MSNHIPDVKKISLHLPGKLEASVSEKLTYRQELFCRYYTQNPEVCLNGTLSYAAAYGFDLDALDNTPIYEDDGHTIREQSDRRRAENVCANCSSVLLRNPKIDKRISELFTEMLNDTVVDRELIKIIMTAPKMSDRVSAIREYNALKQRIIKKLDLTTKGESLNTEERKKVEDALEKVL